MRFFRVYGRVLGLLGRDIRVAGFLALANLLVAGLQFLDPVLFGRVVNLLSQSDHLGSSELWHQAALLLGVWAVVGVVGILSNISVSVQTERLAHRHRIKSMGRYFRHVLALPLSFHGDTHSGRLIKSMLTGTDGLFGTWLVFFRDQLSTILSAFVLLPMTLFLNWRLGLVLIALVFVFLTITGIVVKKTETAQRRVEGLNSSLAGTAQDALSNVMVVQSFTRLSAEGRLFSDIAQQVIQHQFPVLNWWALVNVMTRASSTLAVITIVVIGTWLHVNGMASVGEIVSFMGFAMLLIGRLETAAAFVSSLFFKLPALEDFFNVLDARSSVPEKESAHSLWAPRGEVRFDDVSFAYPSGGGPVLSHMSFIAKSGSCVALVGHTGAGKSTAMAMLQRLWDPSEGRISIDGQDLRDVTPGKPALQHRRGVPGEPAVQPLDPRQSAGRTRRCERGGDRAGVPHGRCARVHHPPAARLRHDDRRARNDAVGRPASASGDRAGAAEEPADPDPGRSDQCAGRGDRGTGGPSAEDADGRAHDVHHCASSVDGARR